MEEQELHFGMVKVIKGRHKGKIGEYDDDDTDDNGKDKAIVYLHGENEDHYNLIPHSWLKNIEVKEEAPTENKKLCRDEHKEQVMKELKAFCDKWGIEDYMMIAGDRENISHYSSSNCHFKIKGMALTLHEIATDITKLDRNG